MTLNFLDNTCTKIENMAFKTSQMNQIALEYWYYGFLGRLRVDGRGFLHKTPILKNCSPEQKSSCRTCAEACHSPFKRLTKFQVKKKKGLLGLQDSYQDRLVFVTCTCMTNFMCRICSLCCCTCEDWILNSQGYWVKQKQSYKFSISDFPKLYPATL